MTTFHLRAPASCYAYWDEVEAQLRTNPDDIDTLHGFLKSYQNKSFDEVQLYVMVSGLFYATSCDDLMTGFRTFLPHSWCTADLGWLDTEIKNALEDEGQWDYLCRHVGLLPIRSPLKHTDREHHPLPPVASSEDNNTASGIPAVDQATLDVAIGDPHTEREKIEKPTLPSKIDLKVASTSANDTDVKATEEQNSRFIKTEVNVYPIVLALKALKRPSLSISIPATPYGEDPIAPKFSPLTPPQEAQARSTSPITSSRRLSSSAQLTLNADTDPWANISGGSSPLSDPPSDLCSDYSQSGYSIPTSLQEQPRDTDEGGLAHHDEMKRRISDGNPSTEINDSETLQSPGPRSTARAMNSRQTRNILAASTNTQANDFDPFSAEMPHTEPTRRKNLEPRRGVSSAQIHHVGPIYPTRREVLARDSKPYIHAVCGKRFLHPEDVRAHHVRKGRGCRAKGNSLAWDAHPSCRVSMSGLNYKIVKEGYVILDQESADKIDAAISAGSFIAHGAEILG